MSEENTTKQRYTKTISISGSRPDSKVHSLTVSNMMYWFILLGICAIIGAVLGFIAFSSRQVLRSAGEVMEQRKAYDELQTQYDYLTIANEELQKQIQVLSDTINTRKALDELEAAEALEASMPYGFPVTGSVVEAEPPEEDTALEMAEYYTADIAAVVVATGVGEVFSVRENAYGNYEIQIDHGHGYMSVYTNGGVPLLEEGVTVSKGTPLFLIDEDNTLVKYQITHNGALVNVYDIMHIDG